MEAGLIGFPLSGKTTIFNAITGLRATTSNFLSSSGKLNLAEVKIPDERLAALARIFKPRQITPATILVKDLTLEIEPNAKISNAALTPLRNLDVLVLVIRAFENKAVPSTNEKANPLSDFKNLLDCLIFNDYEICERRLERIKKEGKLNTREAQLLQGLSLKLAEGQLIGSNALDKQDAKLLSGYCFLTAKPILVLASTGQTSFSLTELEQECQKLNLSFFTLRGDLESEIAQLPEAEQKAFLADLGVQEPAVKRFVKEIYRALKLISFLTVGETEVKAWSIREGTTAVNAAGKIHTDLEKGFIRAEVVFWQDLVECGSFAEAKKSGRLKIEGKEYLVKDGDVLTIRFNV